MTTPELSTLERARDRSDRIHALPQWINGLQQEVVNAYRHRDWAVLGYPSWPSYIWGEFGDRLPGLTIDERRDLVAYLRAEGLTTRAIAATTRQSEANVRKDLYRHQARTSGVTVDIAEKTDQKNPRHRRAITTTADELGTDLWRWTAKLERLLGDNRLREHSARVDAALRAHVVDAMNAMNTALQTFDRMKRDDSAR